MEGFEGREAVDARRATYLFLSSSYMHEVPLAVLEQLAEEPSAYEGVLGNYAASLAEADLEQARVDAAADFARLFLGMSPSPVTPYESVYRSEKQLLMQKPRDEVVAAYSNEGFRCSPELRLPEDHLGFELEFMALLCQKELDALDACDAVALSEARSAQRAFLEEHLLGWAPQLCADVLLRTKEGFYAGVAEATSVFLSYEEREFDLDG